MVIEDQRQCFIHSDGYTILSVKLQVSMEDRTNQFLPLSNFKYEISQRWEPYFKFESDNRDSNSDLEAFMIRRPYNNYAIIAGVIYTLPEIKWVEHRYLYY